MTPIPLNQLGFGWRDHKSALWWLGLFYRRPPQVLKEFEALTRWKRMGRGLLLYLHLLPYLILLFVIGRLAGFGIFCFEAETSPPTLTYQLTVLVVAVIAGFASGIAIGIPLAIAGRINGHYAHSIITGVISGFALTLPASFVIHIFADNLRGSVSGLAGGLAITIANGIAIRTATRIQPTHIFIVTFTIAGITALVMAGSLGSAFAVIFATYAIYLRFYYLPLHLLLIWPEPRLRWVHFHPAFWDDLCALRFVGLDYLLAMHAETQRQCGENEIQRIINSYPAQRIEALKAKTILLAWRVGDITDLTQLDNLLAALPEGDEGFLSQTVPLRTQVSEISRLQVVFNTTNLPAFRFLQAEILVKEIENFRERITGYRRPLATEFQAAASQWLLVAQRQLDECRQNATQEATPQVFRAGDPVNLEQQEAFTPRYPVIESLRQQVMLQTGCPGIVLYGRRRMGKSTLLRNLTSFLPPEVLTVNVSMQNPTLAASLASFARTLAEQVQTQARELKLNEPLPDDLPGLFRFLTTTNERLAATQKRLLLGVDEYEAIDAKIGAGVFPPDLLDTLRESIQTHRRLTWIFAGSHEITELPHAAWTSALVSARTIEVPAFTLAETRLLLTEPLKHSALWRDNEAKRPRFDAAFWGTEEGSGIDFIHAQAGGWPHLVQLIAETLVDLVNEEEAHAVTPQLMQRALDKAIVRGHNVLYELLHRECQLPGEWEYVEGFKRVELQPAPSSGKDDEAIARSLRRRELMTMEGDEWRLRVPLMLRWLRVRG